MRSATARRILFLLRSSWGWWLLALLFLVGVLVRTYRFGDVPPGMNQDEASLAYDAFSLLHYGIERNGFPYPVMLVAYGSGMSGTLAAYLSMPFIAVLGLTPVSARMFNLVVGLASLPLIYLLARRFTDRPTAAIAMFLLAINPWHILISRWGLDCNLFPGLFLGATTTLLYAEERRSLLPVSFALFALSLYAYGTAYVVVPLFLLPASILLLMHRRIHVRDLLVSALVFGMIALPLAAFLAINQLGLDSVVTSSFSIPHLPTTPRYQAASSLFGGNLLPSVAQNLRVFWEILATQNDGLLWNAMPAFGTLYLWSGPLTLLGGALAIRNVARTPRDRLLYVLLWFATAVLLAASMEVNINRINIVFLPLILLTAVAVGWLRRFPAVCVGILALFAISFAQFAHAYFTQYPAQIGPLFFASLGDAIDHADVSVEGPVCVTDQPAMAEVTVLFERKVDPHIFAQTVSYEDPGALYRHARSFGRYAFGLDRCAPGTQAYVFHISEISRFPEGAYAVQAFGDYGVAFPAAITPSAL